MRTIEGAPATDKVSYMRRKIIEIFMESQQRRLQLGDRRASDLYNEIDRTQAAPSARVYYMIAGLAVFHRMHKKLKATIVPISNNSN